MTCIADDTNACDCDACLAAEEQFERDQGWHNDDLRIAADDAEDGRDQCVLGDECCCPHIYHGADECFTAEMAEGFMRAESVRNPSGRHRTRALWRKRGRR